MELIKRAFLAYVIFAFAFVVLGICFLAWPHTSIMTVCYILGAVTLAWGLVKISTFVKNKENNKTFSFQFNLIFGIFLVVTGGLLIIFPTFILPVIPIVIGIILVSDGIHKVKIGFDVKKAENPRWVAIEFIAGLTIIFGICLIINPFDASNAMVFLLGLALLADGIQNIVVIILTFKQMSQIILPEDKNESVFVDEDIPFDTNADVKTEKINPEDMTIEDNDD